MVRAGIYLYRALGTAIAIGAMEFLATFSDEPMWRIPFVTSIVLVTALPHSEASRPYSIIVGHMASCTVGLVALFTFGAGATASAVGVGLASLAMLALRAPHPPSGIDAFVIAAHDLPARWIVNPVLVGCLLLVVFSQAWTYGERAIFGPDSRQY